MAKRSSNRGASKSGLNDTLDIQLDTNYNESEQIRVTSKFPAKLMYEGQVTGQLYVWERAGAVVNVDVRDVPDLLSKQIGGGCCGNRQQENSLFEI